MSQITITHKSQALTVQLPEIFEKLALVLPVASSLFGVARHTTVSSRDLHSSLEVSRDHATWVKQQIANLRLVENVDYVTTTFDPTKFSLAEVKASGGRIRVDYFFSLNASQHIAAMSKTEVGHNIREYLFAVTQATFSAIEGAYMKQLAQKQDQVDNHKRMRDESEADCMTLAKKQGYNSISLALHGAQKSEDSYKAVMNINGLKCQSELGRVTVNRIEDLLQSVKKDLPEPMATRLERTFRVYNEEMGKDVPAVNPY